MKERFHQISHLLSSAYAYKNYEAVQKLAHEYLNLSEQYPTDWNYGNAIHIANLALGLAALREADIPSAKAHLLKAGHTKGSPQLNSFGPNMRLAKELLEVGEPEVVVAYLELCEKFWSLSMRQMVGNPLNKWKALILAGEIPDFGPNLIYHLVAEKIIPTYRLLLPSEVKLYRQIRLESLQNFPNSFGSIYEEQKAKKELGFESNIKQQLSDKFIMGVFSNSNLLGICGFYRNSDLREQHKGAIIQMYIRPSYHGQKIGSTLLDATLQQAFQLTELKQVNLGVYAHNKAAIHLYKKAGFEVYGVEQNCLKLKEGFVDLILMTLRREAYRQ